MKTKLHLIDTFVRSKAQGQSRLERSELLDRVWNKIYNEEDDGV